MMKILGEVMLFPPSMLERLFVLEDIRLLLDKARKNGDFVLSANVSLPLDIDVGRESELGKIGIKIDLILTEKKGVIILV